LWESRYKSSLIQEETYLLNCQRYIFFPQCERVEEPALYRFRSYRFKGLFRANQYVSPHPVYVSLGKNSKSRQTAYRNGFRAEFDTEALSDIRQALTQNQPLGNSPFYAKLETLTGQLCSPKPRARPKKPKDNRHEKNLKQGELPL